MAEINVSITGNLVSDVSFRVTDLGTPMARFRVASTERRFDRATELWVDGNTTYWNVTAWRRSAENARESLAKGHPVVVTGRLRQRTTERQVDGASGVTIPVTYIDIDATSFGLDLSRCRAQYQRAPIGPQTSQLLDDDVESTSSPFAAHTQREGAPGSGEEVFAA